MSFRRPCTAARAILLAAAFCPPLQLFRLSAQDAPAAGPPAPAEASTPAAAGPGEEADLVRQTLSLDISTASFYELADWLGSLGLSDSGSVSELRSRLYEHYGVKAPDAPAAGKTITIERALSAEYFTVEGQDGAVIRVSGGVVLTVRDADSGETQTLEADEIVYDKERNAVSARGHVRYKRTTSTSSEEFSGQTLNVDLDDWSGVFLDGKLRRSGSSSTGSGSSADGSAASSAASGTAKDRGFSFEAETILKRSGDLLVLDNGLVTACDAESPHFSIRAKRLWLLGPNEWAIADAVLSMGEVPLIWIPFFFYPGEELVFHPVLGFREREGHFLQTTIYLIGSKPRSTGSSILSIAQGDSTGKKQLRGVFLKPVEGTAPKDSGASLKLLADVYSSLGACVGIIGNFPKAGPFEGLKFDVEAGVSRSIFSTSTSTGYSPYSAAGDWASVWNESSFLSAALPLRFAFSLSTTLKTGLGNVSVALPLYSDRYFSDDFGNRSEDMDWIGISEDSSSATASSSTITSFTQKVEWSHGFTTTALSPWLGSVNVNRLAASVAWLSALNETLKASESSTLFAVDPARYYFYPNILRPLDLSLSLKGSLLPAAAKAAERGADGLVLRSPWDGPDSGSETPRDAAPGQASSRQGTSTQDDFRLPKRLPSFAASSAAASSWSLTWTLDPSAYVEQRLLSGEWEGPADIDMSELLYSLMSWHLGASLATAYNAPGGAFSGSLSLGWVYQDQKRTTTDNSTYASLVSSYLLTDYEYRLSKLTSSLKLTARPFADFWLLSPTTLSYGLESYLFEYSYAGLDGDDQPVYTTLAPAWNSTMVTSHTASALLGLRTGASTQSLGLTMSLPPTSESYTGAVNLAASPGGWKCTAALKDRMYRTSSLATFSWDPLSFALSVTAPFGLALSDTLTYDMTLGDLTGNTATLGWGPASASLVAAQGYYYYPVIGSGWVAYSSEKTLVLSSFKAAFSKTWKSAAGSPFTASLAVDASYTQSLLQFSNSVLALSLGLTLKVTDVIDVSFKSVSQNSSAWRYCPWLFPAVALTGYSADSYFRNPLVDILDGFAFWDTSARTSSLFKLKSLSVSVARDLHDWNLSFSLTSTPTLDTSSVPYRYVLESEFSILLAWKDVSQIKASLSKDSEGYSF